MTHRPLPNDERLLELLAACAIGDLSPAEQGELQTLLQRNPGVAADELEAAAALADVAFAGAGDQPLPRALRDRVAADAATYFVRERGRTESGPRGARGSNEPRGVPGPLVLSWMATAAAIVVAVIGWWPGTRPAAPRLPVALTPAEARQALMREAADTIVVNWQPPTEAAYTGVTGDVVWSKARQTGFLRLKGMPANDPGRKQYQLWIVDPARDKEPVDGGVFDVPAGDEVIVPVTAKLAVQDPQAFAITLEQSGGVVVSEGPLLVVAAVGS